MIIIAQGSLIAVVESQSIHRLDVQAYLIEHHHPLTSVTHAIMSNATTAVVDPFKSYLPNSAVLNTISDVCKREKKE